MKQSIIMATIPLLTYINITDTTAEFVISSPVPSGGIIFYWFIEKIRKRSLYNFIAMGLCPFRLIDVTATDFYSNM